MSTKALYDKSASYRVYDNDGDEIFLLKNDFDGRNRFYMEESGRYYDVDQLAEIRDVIDQAIKECNKRF